MDDVRAFGNLQTGVDDVVFANLLRDQQVANLDDPIRLMCEQVVNEEDQVGVDLFDLTDNRLDRPRRPAPLYAPRIDREAGS